MKQYYPIFKKTEQSNWGGTLNGRFFQENLSFEDFQTPGIDEYFVIRFFRSPKLGFFDFGILEKNSGTIGYCKI
jgi:hypothetical protein